MERIAENPMLQSLGKGLKPAIREFLAMTCPCPPAPWNTRQIPLGCGPASHSLGDGWSAWVCGKLKDFSCQSGNERDLMGRFKRELNQLGVF